MWISLAPFVLNLLGQNCTCKIVLKCNSKNTICVLYLRNYRGVSQLVMTEIKMTQKANGSVAFHGFILVLKLDLTGCRHSPTYRHTKKPRPDKNMTRVQILRKTGERNS